jgi:hypothetical protein
MQITYYVLMFSVIWALFVRQRKVLYALIAITNILAVYEKILLLPGVGYLALLTVLSFFYFKCKIANKVLNFSLFCLICALLAELALHNLPGFVNQLALDHVQVGSSSRFFSMYLNFDKVMAALLVYTLSDLILLEKSLNYKMLKQSLSISNWI